MSIRSSLARLVELAMRGVKPGSGRRPRVDSTLISVRLIPAELERLDRWRLNELEDQPGRPEALRRLARKVIGKR